MTAPEALSTANSAALVEVAKELLVQVFNDPITAGFLRNQNTGQDGLDHVVHQLCGMRRASSTTAARLAKRGAMARTRSMISCLPAVRGGEGGIRCSYLPAQAIDATQAVDSSPVPRLWGPGTMAKRTPAYPS